MYKQTNTGTSKIVRRDQTQKLPKKPIVMVHLIDQISKKQRDKKDRSLIQTNITNKQTEKQ